MTKGKKWKIAGAVSGVLAGIWAIFCWGPWIGLFWELKIKPSLSDSIGIIGGADGPTVVSVAVTNGSWLGYAVYGLTLTMPLILAAVSVLCFVKGKTVLKKGE